MKTNYQLMIPIGAGLVMRSKEFKTKSAAIKACNKTPNSYVRKVATTIIHKYNEGA